MLRRRFLAMIGPLICAFVLGAAGAVWSLQELLDRYDRASVESDRLVRAESGVNAALVSLNTAHGVPAATALERLDAALGAMEAEAQRAGDVKVRRGVRAIGDMAARAREPGGGQPGADEVQALGHDLAVAVREHVFGTHRQITSWLRWIVLGLTIAALLMVNVAVFVLLRTAQMVLRPVGALIEGSRELAAERFEHRIVVDRDDEFGELARAYNSLAEQLGRIEDRKTEALRQLAVTLNHSLNNAMSIIELQLEILDRRIGGSPAHGAQLRQVRATLERMAGTVASLKNIRRVVLADYAPGEKMIDLEASVAPDGPPTPKRPAQAGAA